MKEQVVLIVEDDFLNRRLTKKVLSDAGYVVAEAKNATEALEQLGKCTVSVAVLDINLGENQMSGTALGKQLTAGHGIPVVYLTAYDTADIIQEAITTSPVSYLTKPFKNSDLIAATKLATQKASAVADDSHYLIVKDGSYNVSLLFKEINYIESDGNYLQFHTNRGIFKQRNTINQVLGSLPRQFIQVHRAFVVNKAVVTKYSLKSLLISDVEIPVSKKFASQLS